MKKIWKITVFALLTVILAACGNVTAKENLTAQEVFEKAKDASTKLESVHSVVSYEDFWRTTVPEDKKSVKYNFISDATLHPETFKQQLIVKPSGEKKAWQANVYKTNDRIFVQEESKSELSELSSGTLSELFGVMMDHVNPTLDLSFFEPFADDFELEPIDYGYNLKLSMSREQFYEFQKLVFGVEDVSGEYAFINKFDIVIGIDVKTFYTTDFKMTLDTTTYSTTEVNGNSHRIKQTISAVYSKYDHVDPVKFPATVQEIAAK